MRTVLFCQNPYAFGILQPVMQDLKARGFEYLWFVKKPLLNIFPFENEPVTEDMAMVYSFKSDAILVPGNEVPHYLRGVKVQVFHGLAGEKKGHFRIRHYFDLYLTQGPYFTRNFLKLKSRYKNFDVIETGWPKLDIYSVERTQYTAMKKDLLETYQCEKIILYAPTFSPSLTSGPYLLEHMESLAMNSKFLILIKFHDLMDSKWIESYRKLAEEHANIKLETDKNIVKYLLLADLMISDTSSVVYEFLLLNKPVITFRSSSQNILWDDRKDYSTLIAAVNLNLTEDPFKKNREEIFNTYHPYCDGLSAKRMIDTVFSYIQKNGVPEKRKLSIWRRQKINKLFGKKPNLS
jgi:CDP-glycerol glycerophosphotransferase (TagB/SpsB family)